MALPPRALNAAQRYLDDPNVVAIYEGHKHVGGQRTEHVCLCVAVRRKLPRDEVAPDRLIPHTLEGAVTDVVEVGTVRALRTATQAFTARIRPCPGGYSVGNVAITAGTLGAWVRKDGKWHILSNNHVLANESRAQVGSAVIQPGAYDGGRDPADRIALLAHIAPFADPVVVDGALAEAIDASVVDAVIHGLGPVRGWRDPQLGEVVRKSGRTTEVTTGTVVGINATVKVDFDTGTRTCIDQFIIGPGGFSAPGDSGSLIVNAEGNAVGLLFAGSDTITVANKISNVIQTLDFEFPPVDVPPPPPAPTSPICRWWAAFRIAFRTANRRLSRRSVKFR